jgi:dihydroorotase
MQNIESLFGPSQAIEYPKEILLEGLFNTHTHLRGGIKKGDGRSETFIPYAAAVYEDMLSIGNTIPPLVTTALVAEQKPFWQSLVPKGMASTVHVAALATEKTDVEDIITGLDKPLGDPSAILAVKMFLRAVSNSGGFDVDNLDAVIPLIRAMSDRKKFKHRRTLPVLKIHAERKYTLLGRRISFIDRERAAVERDIERILMLVPEANIEICHVSLASTLEAIDYYQLRGYNVFGEISPHYGHYTTDDLFEDGKGGTAMNSHPFCLPIFKTPADSAAIRSAMTSGKPYFHFGDDEACHDNNPTLESGVKINSAGLTAGGQTQIPEAVISSVLEDFIEARRPLSFAQAFLSDNARQLYALPVGRRTVRFVRKDWVVPNTIEREFPNGKIVRCRVAMGGQTRKYCLAS